MWIRSCSKIYSGVQKKDIWRLWTDVNNWPQWHEDLDFCKLEGPFEVGNHFFLKPKGIKPVKIVLMEVIDQQSFTDCTAFFGAKMYDTQSMEETPQGLRLTNTVRVTGPLAWLWIKLVAQNVAATAPREMETVVKLARQAHG